MITKQELLRKQKEFNIPLPTIEKDYVLGLLLSCLYRHPSIQSDWVFKGGTCLKKAYFRNYRMSEDLDFTLKPSATVDPQSIIRTLSEVFEIGRSLFGLHVDTANLDVRPFPDKQGLFIQIKVPFQSPLMSSGSLPRIKLDLAKNEILVDDSVLNQLFHDYSDEDSVSVPICTYSMDEVFAEKLRALVERTRPRDLYDVVQIYERVYKNKGMSLSFQKIISDKFKFKNLIYAPSVFSVVEDRKQEVIEAWNDMLAHQINPLESFDTYLDRFKTVQQHIF